LKQEPPAYTFHKAGYGGIHRMNDQATIIERLLKERIHVIDGAMGTMIQNYKLDEAGD
jgi:hypothetical protein